MNRRGFFGALAGGIAAATGLRVSAGRHVTILKGTALGKSEAPVGFMDVQAAVGADADAILDQIEYEARGLARFRAPVASPLGVAEAAEPLGIARDVEAAVDDDLQALEPDALSFSVESPVGPDADMDPAIPTIHPPSLDEFRAKAHACFRSMEPSMLRPSHGDFITATAVLPPVAQMKRLLDRFGTSGEASPAFVEALIGELVLTRVRLAAADPRVLCSFDPVAA